MQRRVSRAKSSRARGAVLARQPQSAYSPFVIAGTAATQGVSRITLQVFRNHAARFRFGQRTTGGGFHDPHGLQPVKPKPVAVIRKEQPGGNPGGALIAIGKTVVSQQPICVGRGQRGSIGLAIFRQVHGPRQCGLHSTTVANTVKAPVLGQQAVVDRVD